MPRVCAAALVGEQPHELILPCDLGGRGRSGSLRGAYQLVLKCRGSIPSQHHTGSPSVHLTQSHAFVMLTGNGAHMSVGG